jgi:hypothetical protein
MTWHVSFHLISPSLFGVYPSVCVCFRYPNVKVTSFLVTLLLVNIAKTLALPKSAALKILKTWEAVGSQSSLGVQHGQTVNPPLRSQLARSTSLPATFGQETLQKVRPARFWWQKDRQVKSYSNSDLIKHVSSFLVVSLSTSKFPTYLNLPSFHTYTFAYVYIYVHICTHTFIYIYVYKIYICMCVFIATIGHSPIYSYPILPCLESWGAHEFPTALWAVDEELGAARAESASAWCFRGWNIYIFAYSYGHLPVVISTKKTPFIECIIPFITTYNW